MPTFNIADTEAHHLRTLIQTGDVDANLYRNLLYTTQLNVAAMDTNLGAVYVGNTHVSDSNYDLKLNPGDAFNQNDGIGVDSYVRAQKMLAAPGAPTRAAGGLGTNLLTAGSYRWKITFVTASGETEAGAASTALTVDPATQLPPDLSAIPVDATTGVTVTARKIYRTAAGGTVYKLVATLSDNTTTVYNDNIPDASLGTTAPTTNTAVPMKINVLWESPFPVEM